MRRPRKPSRRIASKAAATLSLLGASAGGRARSDAMTPEQRRVSSAVANAAQGRGPSRAWWEVPRRRAWVRHRCVLCRETIKAGEEYFDRGSNPRRAGCVPCVLAILATMFHVEQGAERGFAFEQAEDVLKRMRISPDRARARPA